MSNSFQDSGDPVRKQAPEEFLPAGTEEQAFDLITLAKRSIRGRVLITAVIATALGILFAVVGYTRSGLEYQSRVVIHVRDSITSLTGDQLQNDIRQDDFIARKKQEFKGEDILLYAVSDPRMLEIGWPSAEYGAGMLSSSISTDHRRRDAFFTAVCTTDNPDTAQVALKVMIDSFLKFEEEKNGIAKQEGEINDAIRQRDGQIELLNQAIMASTNEYGTRNLDTVINGLEESRNILQGEIENLNIRISLLNSQAASGDDIALPEEQTPRQLALSDTELAQLHGSLDDLQARIDNLIETKGSRYPEIPVLKNEQQILERRIEARAKFVRGLIAGGTSDYDLRLFNLQELKNQRDISLQTQELQNQKLRELRVANESISRDMDKLSRLREERSNLKDNLGTLRLNQPRLQLGRVEIPGSPSVAIQARDKRPILAGMGFVAGMMMGVAGMIAFGTLNRSFRYVDDLDSQRHLPPLLGTLPELEKHDPENERVAAVSVHNLRNTLQSIQGYGDNNSVVIACTSAEPGDGKTTLIQSLGASYALTGLRTILVDLDLVGSGLTSRLGLSGRRGVADLLTGLEPTKCIKHTPTEKLYAMPIGDTTKCKPEQLASRPIQQIVDWLRERFDVVLIDTGPVLGCLEAGIVTAVADQVLLVVARGQSDSVVHAAVGRLERLGILSTGLVFNRADPEDLRTSLSAASVGAPSMHQIARKHGEHSLDLDHSIVGSISSTENSGTASRRTEDETGT